MCFFVFHIIKYIPLQQGLRQNFLTLFQAENLIIKYIPLQQGLRHVGVSRCPNTIIIIKYIPLQQGLRPFATFNTVACTIIKYIPLQQGLRLKLKNEFLTTHDY